MKIKHVIAAIAITSATVFSTTAFAENDLVKNYVDASKNVVKNSYGECWRTSYTDTTDKKVECGYETPAPTATVEVVATPTAATVTKKVVEKITIAANMLFGFDSAELSDDAKAVIDERINRFKGAAKLTSVMEVRGYTCSMGPAEYNQTLSEKRAQAVADYIAANAVNVSTADMKVVGMGEADPVASNDTKEGRMQNRRVEIIAHGEITK